MEVEVANGSWRHGLVLSVRLGEVRRQAPLQCDTRIVFPKAPTNVQYMQVDVFAKVGSEHIVIDPAKQVYDLNVDGEGFSSLALRVHSQGEAGSGQGKRLEDAVASEYIDQHNLNQLSTDLTSQSQSRSSPKGLPRPHSASGSGDTVKSVTEERLQKVRQDAAKYIERFDLRQVLQDMFQQVIKERPADPFGFMQTYLDPSVANKNVARVEADAEEERRRAGWEREYERQIEAQRISIEKLNQEIVDARSQANSVSAMTASAERATLQKDHQGSLERQRVELGEQLSQQLERQRSELEEQKRQQLEHQRAEMEGQKSELLKQLRAELNDQHGRQLEQQRIELEQRTNFVERQRTEMEQRHAKELAGQRTELEQTSQQHIERQRSEQERQYEQRIEQQKTNIGMLQRRIQELETGLTNSEAAVREQRELEQQRNVLVKQQETNIEVLQRRVQELEVGIQMHQKWKQDLENEHRNELTHQETKMSSVHQRRIKDLEAEAATRNENIARELRDHQRQIRDREDLHQQQIKQQEAQIEMLQRRIQAFKAASSQAQERGTADSAAGAEWIPPRGESPGDQAAGMSREIPAVNKMADTQFTAEPAMATGSTAFPPSTAGPYQSTGMLPGSMGMNTDVNTHMFSRLLASTYAPPVPPTTYMERREDEEEYEIKNVDPGLLVEVVDCTDPMSNGIFAWVGVCNMKPLYRLLGSEPRYLHFNEADIASDWRIVDKMGSENCVERFRKPMNARLPTQCEKGSHGSIVTEAKLTSKGVQLISMIASQEEKAIIRSKFTDVFGSQFTKLEGLQRGLISKTSPVVGVAHALEAQQRAIQLLHNQLASETQRREAAESHAHIMEEAFETLQLRIQAQLPGPPSLASLVDLQASLGSQAPGGLGSPPSPLAIADSNSKTPEAHDRGLVMEMDGSTSWAPDTNGPVPRPPVAPKDVKPAPPPTFGKMPRGLRPASAQRHIRAAHDNPSVPSDVGDTGKVGMSSESTKLDEPMNPAETANPVDGAAGGGSVEQHIKVN